MNDIIYLITTKGCEGCKIAERLIKEAINKSTFTHIQLKIIDCLDDNYKQLIKDNNITDFPTMLFVRENYVLYKYIGTSPIHKIINLIQYWFK